MKGQWRGLFSGYATGEVTLEIDELDTGYSGRACFFQEGLEPLVFVVGFQTRDKLPEQLIFRPISIQKIADTSEVDREELKRVVPDYVFPDKAKAKIWITRKGLSFAAKAYYGDEIIGEIFATLTDGNASKRSSIRADKKINTWDKFKTMVGKIPTDKYIFRGQSVCNRLRTSFHRTNRRDLGMFMNNDIPMLHAIVTSKTNHYFDLRDNVQNASFWNLLQHHGYPTPLLDWSHSPYVAAYFAFREKAAVDDPKRKIRIFMFDRSAWTSDYSQLGSVVNVKPHFSILNPVALENPRALPQQAICTITTVDDVEDYIEFCGKKTGAAYLRVFELSYVERSAVLSDLRLMGVAAGSLFPGIDGACEEMKLRNFGF